MPRRVDSRHCWDHSAKLTFRVPSARRPFDFEGIIIYVYMWNVEYYEVVCIFLPHKSTTPLAHSCSTPAPPRQCFLLQIRSSGHFQLSNHPAICTSKCCWGAFHVLHSSLVLPPAVQSPRQIPWQTGETSKIQSTQLHIQTYWSSTQTISMCMCCRRSWKFVKHENLKM